MQGMINPAVIGLVSQVNILTQTRSIPAGLFWTLELKINIQPSIHEEINF